MMTIIYGQEFEFVNSVISTIFSPFSALVKRVSGKQGKEPAVFKAKFQHLTNRFNSTMSKGLENYVPDSTPLVLLRSPYVDELSELSVVACTEKLTIKSPRSAQIVQDFCSENLNSLKLLHSLGSLSLK